MKVISPPVFSFFRKEVVQDFIREIEMVNPEENDWTGYKIMCYMAGGKYHTGIQLGSQLPEDKRYNLQEYLRVTKKGYNADEYHPACKIAWRRGKF